MGCGVDRASARQVNLLLRGQLDLYFTCYCLCHLFLQCQNIARVALVILCPEMGLILHLDELSADAHALACAPNSSFEDVIHAQLFADLVDPFLGAFVLNGRGSRDDAKTLGLQLTEAGDHLLGQAIAEVFLFGIATEIFKGQYRKHDFSGWWTGTVPEAVANHVDPGDREEES